MNYITVLEEELQLIANDKLKDTVIDFLKTKVPDYFWSVPASSSGKYHPKFSNGYGGLIRHTKMVVAVVDELMRIDSFSHTQSVKDAVVAACIIHDTFKHGYNEGYTITSHPTIAADEWAKFVGDDIETDTNQIIYFSVLCHMGQWGPESANRKIEGYISSCVALVHLADYIASRKFFDKFGETVNEN